MTTEIIPASVRPLAASKPLPELSSGPAVRHASSGTNSCVPSTIILPLTSKRICELVKRRQKVAGLPSRLSPHSFRVKAITNLLTQGVPLEDVLYLAGHSEPRTTGLYDRPQKKVTRNIVERISI